VRTTLDLDDDVVAAARELAAEQRRSLGSLAASMLRTFWTRFFGISASASSERFT